MSSLKTTNHLGKILQLVASVSSDSKSNPTWQVYCSLRRSGYQAGLSLVGKGQCWASKTTQYLKMKFLIVTFGHSSIEVPEKFWFLLQKLQINDSWQEVKVQYNIFIYCTWLCGFQNAAGFESIIVWPVFCSQNNFLKVFTWLKKKKPFLIKNIPALQVLITKTK